MSELPLIDVSPLLGAPEALSSRRGRETVQALGRACHGPGFCYLAGHGVPVGEETAAQEAARRFFALPLEQRRSIAIGRSPHFRGYTLLGDERTGGKSDWRDQIDIGPEEPALELGPGDPAWLRLRGPNQWPAGLPELREATSAWMAYMQRLGLAMMRALALALGQPVDRFDEAMQPEPYTRLKIIRYPAQDGASDTGQGLGLHQDSGLLSFVLQDEVGGLQVESAGGLVDAEPRPGTYVMNLGEMMQAASGGYLRATRHRVVSPPPGRERISLAYFVNPRLDAVFEPVTLPPDLARQAAGAQNDDPDDPVFSTFGENTLKIRMRAHPDVTAAFYADVASRVREPR